MIVIKDLKSLLNSTFLAYLAGAGLDAAFVDVFDKNIMKAIYIARAFRDNVIFTPSDLEV
jgi:cobalamin-dependent methionine synthase I